MEAFTSGKISARARRAYLADRAGGYVTADNFQPVRGGYLMFAWESSIRFARAMGRGAALGSGKPVHPFDA
jgi:hypothetical protein